MRSSSGLRPRSRPDGSTTPAPAGPTTESNGSRSPAADQYDRPPGQGPLPPRGKPVRGHDVALRPGGGTPRSRTWDLQGASASRETGHHLDPGDDGQW